MGAYARSLGRLCIVVIVLMGVFAGVAHASSVAGVTVDNTSPSTAAGARTVYFVSFTTSPTGALSRANNDAITVTFPTGTDINTALGNTFVSDVTAGGSPIGSCGKSGQVATCTLNSGVTIPAGHQISIEFDGIINPASASTTEAVTVSTTKDTTAATSSFYTVVAGNQVSQPTVSMSSPSAATGARTVYLVNFTTSSTGALSRQAVSNIIVTFPTGTDINTALGNTFVSDVTAGGSPIGSCGKSGQVATCTLNSGVTIPAGDQISIEFDGIINPAAGAQTLTVKTSSDTPAVTSAAYNVVAGNQVSQPTVSMSSPSAATGARTVYLVNFTTSSTGALSRQAVSNIIVTFPTGTDINTALGNTFVSDVTAGGSPIGSCGKSGQVATCTLNSGVTIPAGDQISIEFDGIINPAAGAQTLTVKTSSDTPAVTSAAYNVVAGNQVSQPTVSMSSPSAATGARTVYLVNFTTSSTGALSRQAVSNIIVTFPTGTDINTALGNTFVSDVTAGGSPIGSCGKSGQVATCTLNSGVTIPAGDQISIEFDGIINPAAGAQTLTVKTSSDTPAVTSAAYNVVAGNQVSQPTVTLSNHAPSAAGVQYTVSFTTSPTGGLSRQAVSNIIVTFPTGTDINSGLGNTFVSDVTAGGSPIGSCGKSGQVATCTLNSGVTIPAGHQVSIELDRVINPASTTTETLTVKTSSDTPQVTSTQYSIGGAPPPPTVTSVSPSSGPTGGGNSVTINGTNLSGATVNFGSLPATVMSDDGLQIIAIAPAHAAGPVDVTVSTAGGTSVTSANDRYTYSAPFVPSAPPPSQPAAPPAVTPKAPSPTNPSVATVSGSVNPEGLATTVVFQYGLDPSLRGPGASTALYDQSTAPQPVGSDSSNHTVNATLSGLVPNALYHVRVVASNSAGTTNGPDQTFTTQRPATPPPPVLGQSQTAQPVSGKTFILVNGKFVPLTASTKIPSGATIDALHGALSLTSATGVGKKTQTGTFSGAVFKLTQAHSGLTTLALVNNAFKGAPSFASCTAKHTGKASAAALSARTIQLLHGRDNHGKFRSKGRYAAATTRGTVWSMADRCDGTLTQVNAGTVVVSDFVRRRNVTVGAHHSYLAKAHK